MKDLESIYLDRESLEQCGVGALMVFGSQVDGTAHQGSDIDIGVLLKDFTPLRKDPLNVYGILHEMLTEAIGEEIDMVYLHEAPLSLQFHAVMEGIPIFFTSPGFYYDYKERMMLRYFDFRFFEKIFDEALLER